MRRFLSATGFASLLFLTACSFLQPASTQTKDASTLFQEGEQSFEQGHYAEAVASWEKARESYYSPELNLLIELKVAEAYFLDEKYIEATAAYEAFLKNHPEHPRVPDVLYQLGLCYQRQMLATDQDQTATRQALSTFETLLKRYPQDQRRDEVQSYIAYCRNQLAANELVIAHFYLKTGKYQAAINRLEGIFSKYPAYPNNAEVFYYLGQAYLLDGDRSRAGNSFASLFNQYPYSAYAEDAEAFIRKHN